MIRRHKVQINYQSGRSVVITCRDFTVNRRGSKIASVEWENAKPDALHMGIDDIESIWQLR